MLRHIVFFSVKDPQERQTVFDGLSILKTIPHGRNLEVGEVKLTDPIPGHKVDFVVYGEFEDADELAAYKAHPVYQQSIEIVRPLRELRIAADYFAPGM